MQREGPTKIICVGRNYAEHASELGNAVPEKLLYFLKPPSSLLDNGGNVVLPAGVGRVDCEG
ncbi:MAG: fumarylacetoacetate hydrolase family protein, partial [Thermoplasmata archaeon]|nr:fumarylacetoacetate hydrolase family protein [Candidatus Sysuiplasma acidicola]